MTQPLPAWSGARRRCLLGALALALPARAAGRTLTVGAGERWRTLADAVRAAASGDTIALQPGTYAGDVAVVTQPMLTIRGLGSGALLQADGRHAEGKAILVLRGDGAVVQNLEFRGARVPSGNGAGIRFERGRLLVERCRFFDNEMGLLSANDPDMELDIRNCEFGDAPRHEGSLHHLVYVGAIRRFTLVGSHVGRGWRGHLVKSRARANVVRYNLLDDSRGGEASYELEFAEGGDGLVVGNVIVQSAQTQNPALFSVGAEAKRGATVRLVLAHNTLVNEAGASARFVQLWPERSGVEGVVRCANNLWAGAGDAALPADADLGGNHRIALDELSNAGAGDYRLAAASPLAGSAVALPPAWLPSAEFAAPAGTRALPAGGALSPGALQTLPPRVSQTRTSTQAGWPRKA